jgi:hypothetical protein
MARYPHVFAAYEAFKRAVRARESPDPNRPFILVERPEDLPLFASEDEEHEYWGTHEMAIPSSRVRRWIRMSVL